MIVGSVIENLESMDIRNEIHTTVMSVVWAPVYDIDKVCRSINNSVKGSVYVKVCNAVHAPTLNSVRHSVCGRIVDEIKEYHY